MTWLQSIFVAALSFGLIGCTSTPIEQTYPQPVSISELHSSPLKYYGMIIAVAGYLNGAETRLFLTAEHRGIEDWPNSISVGVSYKDEELEKSDYPNTGCNEQFVVVYGRWGEHWVGPTNNWPDRHMVRDIYQIAGMKRVEDWGRGPHRLTCWHNKEADPISEIMKKHHAIGSL